MSDKYSCSLHPQGKCGGRYVGGSVFGCLGVDSIRQMEPDTCPWTKTRMKDAPRQETNLERAVNGYTDDAQKHCYSRAYESPMRAALVAVHVDPDASVKGDV